MWRSTTYKMGLAVLPLQSCAEEQMAVMISLLIEIELIYNAVLVSDVQQSKKIYIYICIKRLLREWNLEENKVGSLPHTSEQNKSHT